MEIEIIKENETPLLSRKRLTVKVDFEGKTPARLDLKKDIAKKIKSEPELVVIRHIYQRFGSKTAKVIVHVYSDRKMLERLEDQSIVKKHSEKKPEDDVKEASAEKKEEKSD